ncbi:MAG: glutaredoxin [Pseudomonadota bacterium]|nr:glutaredoxin [Pseudomonadota bacterium]
MKRLILDDSQIHPAIREQIAGLHRATIEQVEQALTQHAVVVVGMRQNPYPKRARKALQTAGIAHHYLEYGSYFSEWQRRGALKRWSGWPTLPMVFVKGVLVGGATDLKRLIDSGELRQLIG